MNTVKTEGAPVVASETAGTIITQIAAPKAKPAARKTGTTIARRKVLMGKHKQTGAPKLEVIGLTKNPRRGVFTLMDIFGANGETISLLTIKKRKNELLKAGKLCKMARDFKQHEGTGRPPEYFNFDLTKGTIVKPKRARKAVNKTPEVAQEPHNVNQNEAPPAPEANVPAPIEQPQVAEQPAAPAAGEVPAAA